MLYEARCAILRTFEHFLLLKPHTVAWPVGLGACLHARRPPPAGRSPGPAGSHPLNTSQRTKHIFRLASTLPLRLA